MIGRVRCRAARQRPLPAPAGMDRKSGPGMLRNRGPAWSGIRTHAPPGEIFAGKKTRARVQRQQRVPDASVEVQDVLEHLVHGAAEARQRIVGFLAAAVAPQPLQRRAAVGAARGLRRWRFGRCARLVRHGLWIRPWTRR